MERGLKLGDSAAIKSMNPHFSLGGGPLLWAAAVAVGLAFNLLLFGMMPLLMSKATPDRTKGPDIAAVSVIRQKKIEQPARKREPQKKQQEPQKTKTKALKTITPPKPAVNKPRLAFDVNPRLPAAPGGLTLPPLENFSMTAPPEPPDLQMDFLESELDSPLTPVYTPRPMFPFRARKMGIEGSVTVLFDINEKGEVTKVTILGAEPEGIFEQEVLRTLPSWKFSHPTVDGRPVRTQRKRTIEFVFE